MALNAGTKVWLKTGSPAMTVKQKTTDDTYLCSWFYNNDVKEHEFAEEQLTTENPAPPISVALGKRGRSNFF